jgi:hypothetical protein
MDRVTRVIDDLCGSGMFGRGYTAQGDRIAADYIVSHFKKAGLKPLVPSYLQKFQCNINTFPGLMALQLDKQVLRPGLDFIPDPASGPGMGSCTPLWLDSLIFTDIQQEERFLKQDLKGKALLLDARWEPTLYQASKRLRMKILGAPLLVAVHDQLTFGASQFQLGIPKINVLRSAIEGKKYKKITFQLDAVWVRGYETANVLGYVTGSELPDSLVVVGAHYDHLGQIGQHVWLPGGNDNASGVAAMIELAYHFAKNPPPYSVVFMAFGAEEAGLLGSEHYTRFPILPLNMIRMMLSLDLFATGEKGMMVVNGLIFTEDFQRLDQLNRQNQYLTQLLRRGKAANSDHYHFSESGVPSFFFYLMGEWPHYHHVYDRPPLPLKGFVPAWKLIRDFVASYGQPEEAQE